MKTVNQVCRATGVSARTLHHYDSIGLLAPTEVTEAGYRLYDEAALERLGQIMLFKELGFPLGEIREILAAPGFDRDLALEQQIGLLKLQKERLEGIISLAENIRAKGVYTMDFKAFDKEKIENYAAEAKKKWGATDAYREFSEKTAGYSDGKLALLGGEMMELFREFGALREAAADSASPEAQAQTEKLRGFITEHYYTCTKQILAGLGQMYAAGGEMTENIDAAGGEGTAAFAAAAITEYCK